MFIHKPLHYSYSENCDYHIRVNCPIRVSYGKPQNLQPCTRSLYTCSCHTCRNSCMSKSKHAAQLRALPSHNLHYHPFKIVLKKCWSSRLNLQHSGKYLTWQPQYLSSLLDEYSKDCNKMECWYLSLVCCHCLPHPLMEYNLICGTVYLRTRPTLTCTQFL